MCMPRAISAKRTPPSPDSTLSARDHSSEEEAISSARAKREGGYTKNRKDIRIETERESWKTERGRKGCDNILVTVNNHYSSSLSSSSSSSSLSKLLSFFREYRRGWSAPIKRNCAQRDTRVGVVSCSREECSARASERASGRADGRTIRESCGRLVWIYLNSVSLLSQRGSREDVFFVDVVLIVVLVFVIVFVSAALVFPFSMSRRPT